MVASREYGSPAGQGPLKWPTRQELEVWKHPLPKPAATHDGQNPPRASSLCASFKSVISPSFLLSLLLSSSPDDFYIDIHLKTRQNIR